MPILHVRNVPDDLYEDLQALAKANHRSISAEVLTILEGAAEAKRSQVAQRKLLARIRRNRISLPKGLPKIEALIREDRKR